MKTSIFHGKFEGHWGLNGLEDVICDGTFSIWGTFGPSEPGRSVVGAPDPTTEAPAGGSGSPTDHAGGARQDQRHADGRHSIPAPTARSPIETCYIGPLPTLHFRRSVGFGAGTWQGDAG